MAGIVRHALEVYTLTLFKEFNKEFMKGISATSTLIGEHDTTTVYRVTSLMRDIQLIPHKGCTDNAHSSMERERAGYKYRGMWAAKKKHQFKKAHLGYQY
ncbi:hypothetical protein ACS0TY_005099 [Phlomoides rotata]